MIHDYLLHSRQVMQLSVVDLLLQHELLEVLRCVRLSLQGLESLKTSTLSDPERKRVFLLCPEMSSGTHLHGLSLI